MRQRLRSWLFILSLLMMIIGPLAVSAVNRLFDIRYQADQPVLALQTSLGASSESTCIPRLDKEAFHALDQVDTSRVTELTVSARIAALFAADQATRQLPGMADAQAVEAGDTQRRLEVLDFILNGELHSPRDLVYAAFIFQHGDCTDHYLFAHQLAELALNVDYDEARWIYAATFDRYLMSLGELQKYGTQYTFIDGKYTLYPVDPATTDAERLEYNVPTLSEAMQRLPEKSSGGSTRRQWLASWWLTLIGAGFASLGALIALVDTRKNAPLGRAALFIALLIYPLSVLGHVDQVRSFQSGTIGTQTSLWTVLNISLLAVWLGLVIIEVVRRFNIRAS